MRTTETIRQEIADLEGELATLAGEGLLLVEGDNTGDQRLHDTPKGGATLTLNFRDSWQLFWYSSTEKALAALAAEARKWNTTPYDTWRFYAAPAEVHGEVTRLT